MENNPKNPSRRFSEENSVIPKTLKVKSLVTQSCEADYSSQRATATKECSDKADLDVGSKESRDQTRRRKLSDGFEVGESVGLDQTSNVAELVFRGSNSGGDRTGETQLKGVGKQIFDRLC